MNKKRGFTLVETMMVVAVTAMVFTGVTALTINIIRSFNWTNTRVDADLSATQALQRLTRDLQTAKQITVLSATSLRIAYPQVNADGTYNKAALDSVNTVDFYRSDSNGTANLTGSYLYRKPATGAGRIVCKNLSEITFSSTNPAMVDITVRTQRTNGTATANSNMVHRAIFLRNY
jgi:prepilin-type N-terminal cleavage/methylation domain-containing protein